MKSKYDSRKALGIDFRYVGAFISLMPCDYFFFNNTVANIKEKHLHVEMFKKDHWSFPFGSEDNVIRLTI